MRKVDLKRLDMNLLYALHALLEERHVTRAAHRVFMSQPAMSRAFERLREMFGDSLLVRSGRGYQRSVRGEQVLRELESLIPRVEALVRGEPFEPARSQERFRVALTDHVAAVLLPPLLQRIRTAAPSARLDVSVWRRQMYDHVAAGRLDTAITAEAAPASLEAEVLYEENFVCLVGSAQHVGTRRFTLKQYVDLPHAVVETWEAQQTPVDRPLAELGLKRRAPLHIPFFVSTALAIARTDLTLTLPRRLAKRIGSLAGVRVVEPPREIKGLTFVMVWHARLTTEPAHVWFREQLRAVARTI